MASGTPTPDLYIAELHDIRDHMKTGEICIEKWTQRANNAMLALEHEVILVDLRPLKQARVVNWDKTYDFVDGMIVKVINELQNGVNSGVHLQNMWVDQQFTQPITFSSNIKIGSLPGPKEITLEFICIPDLKPMVNATVNATKAMQQLGRMMGQVGISINDIPLPHEKLKDLGVSIEPIVAYRDFYADYDEGGDVILCSRNGMKWTPRKKLRAVCKKNGRDPFASHDAPNVGCSCGVYAFDSPDHEDMKDGAYIWGEVYLWGEVLICESGYRAEFAYPKTIFVRTNGTKTIRWLSEELEAVYGVPTFLVATKDGQTLSHIIDTAVAQLAKGGE